MMWLKVSIAKGEKVRTNLGLLLLRIDWRLSAQCCLQAVASIGSVVLLRVKGGGGKSLSPWGFLGIHILSRPLTSAARPYLSPRLSPQLSFLSAPSLWRYFVFLCFAGCHWSPTILTELSLATGSFLLPF